MSDLFAQADEDKRTELIHRGWVLARVVTQRHQSLWRNPEHGALQTEEDAFRWLERQLQQEAKKKKG